MTFRRQGAIDMCNVLLATADPPDEALVTLCSGYESAHDYLKGILNTQSLEITQMRDWLQLRGAHEGTRCSGAAGAQAMGGTGGSGGSEDMIGMGGMRRRRLGEMSMGGGEMVDGDGLTALEVS
jgi:hypothetical protein